MIEFSMTITEALFLLFYQLAGMWWLSGKIIAVFDFVFFNRKASAGYQPAKAKDQLPPGDE